MTASFGGHPIDLGAHWLHAGGVNPLVRLGLSRGEPLRRAPTGGGSWLDGRLQDRAARSAYGAAFERADAAIAAAAREHQDRSIGAALPPLGRWRRSIVATLAVVTGRPVAEASAKDFPSEEFGDNWFVRGGYGAYLSRLAAGLPVRLDCPLERLDWSGRGVSLETPHGRLQAKAAIVTVPIPLLAAGLPRLSPAPPDDLAEAFAAFLPGTYEHVILNWPNSPFRKPDRLVRLSSSRRTFGMLTHMDGAPFHFVDLGHAAVASARGPGRRGLAALVRDMLAEQFGGRALASLRVLAETDWVSDPWSRGAWAVVAPGRFRDRDLLARPLGDRVWFAGEANVREMWGTVGGAWQSGEAAAEEVAGRLSEARAEPGRQLSPSSS